MYNILLSLIIMLQDFYHNEIIMFGIMPVLAALSGYLYASIPLELFIYFFPETYLKNAIVYSNASSSSETKASDRLTLMKKNREKIPLLHQLTTGIYLLIGPAGFMNGLISYLLLKYIFFSPSMLETPSLLTFVYELALMEIAGDFGLYWGHRIQHEVPFIWENFHKMHHKIDTPSPFGTLYIDNTDSTLQGGIPLIFAIILVRPHLLNMYLYICLRVGENVLNHSGLDNTIVNIIFLKFLPLRASIKHHDSHHKFSNYPGGAKNYGEMFWLWDYVFGTYRKIK